MDLEKVAIMRLREGAEISKYYYNKPLLLCYSGGKDSDVILDLAIKSGIEFELQHSHTTALVRAGKIISDVVSERRDKKND